MCDLTEILSEYPKKHKITHAEIADLIGVARSTVERRFNIHDDGAHFPLKDLIPVIRACGNDLSILDHIESRLGRVAFQVPKVDEKPDLMSLARLADTSGAALSTMAEALSDGKIDKGEKKKLADVLIALQQRVSIIQSKLNNCE